MNLWLLNPYGPIPNEGWRDYRFTLLGRELAQRGHAVTWWTGNFSHHFKRYRSKGWQDITVSPGFIIRLVPTSSYTHNISLGRVRFEVNYARHVHKRASQGPRPDAIIAVDPPQTIGCLSVRLAERFDAPLLLDVFDLWPELFVLAFPQRLRMLMSPVLAPLYWLRRRNLRRADAVTALCNTYLNIACRQAPRLCPERSLTVFNGIDVVNFRKLLPVPEERPALARLAGKQLGEIWAIYAGSLGNNYDIQTLLDASVLLQQQGSPVQFRIAGDGPLQSVVSNFVEQEQPANLTYLGKLSHQELAGLYAICDIGLCAYGPDSNVAMPDKAYDYMVAGLPIVNSLRGELEMLLHDQKIGLQYVAGSASSLAAALAQLAYNDDLRHLMADHSYQAASQFDSQLQYGRFADFIERSLPTQHSER